MKYFINILIAICFLFMVQAVSAQTIGANVGLNISGVLAKDKNGTYTQNYLPLAGFHLGASFDYSFKFGKIPNLVLAAEAGFLIETKGFASKVVVSALGLTSTTNTTNMHWYLNFPLKVRTGFDLDVVKIYAITGFCIGTAIYGERVSITTYSFNSDKDIAKRDVKWGNDSNNDDYRALDFGLLFGVGVELGAIPLRIELIYNLGLANIWVNQNNNLGSLLANRTFAISVGYRFLDFSKDK